MGDIYFTSNPSDFAKLEGLYVSERKPPGFIRGIDLSTVGLAGKCVRGPLTPQLITSSGDFENIYGTRDYGAGGAIRGGVWAAMLNKPFGSVVVRRVAASDATVASHIFSDVTPTAICTISASSVGAWGLGVTVGIETASDADANHFNIRASYLGREVVYKNIDLHGGADNSAVVIGSDPARFITLTKTVDGRPLNASSLLSTGGSDGTLAVADYNTALDDLAVYPGVGVVAITDIVPTVATMYAHLVTIASTVADRIFLTWAHAHGNTRAQEITAQAAAITTGSDRIWWCYNSPYTVDPRVSAEIQTGPDIWLASILSQIDIDVHPGAFETEAMLSGVTRLTNTSLSRGDLVALKAAGISTLERLANGFQFRSVVTTEVATPGLQEGTRRRMADFLQLSAANRLRSYVKQKNTPEIRALMAGELTAFSRQLQRASRVVADFEIDQKSVNNDTNRAAGEEHLLWRVKLVSHMLALVLETEISTGTLIAH